MTSTSTQTTAAPWTVDADRWPDVAVAAGSRARAAIARAVFTTAAARLPLRVKLPDGRLVGTGGPAAPVMVLRHPREFFRRFGASGLIGFGESYMAGDWDSADLTGLLAVFAAHADELVPTWLQRLRTLAVRRQPPDDLQTVQARGAAGLGFDEVFNRMWKFYLRYSEAGFRGGYIGVSHLSCGARASSVWPVPTSVATSTSGATSPTACAGYGAPCGTRLPAGSPWPRRPWPR